SAGAAVVLSEVGKQERTTAAGVLGVAAHHRQPRELHLVLAFGFRLRRLQRRGDGRRLGPANIAVVLPERRAEIGQTGERGRLLPRAGLNLLTGCEDGRGPPGGPAAE